MTKEHIKVEKIKEAWMDLMPGYTNIDLNSGWSLDKFDEDEFDTMQIYMPCRIRPKSLQGIGNNNGWIKIESEDDLPKERVACWIKDMNRSDLICGEFLNNSKEDKKYWLANATHYRIIEKPKLPIY